MENEQEQGLQDGARLAIVTNTPHPALLDGLVKSKATIGYEDLVAALDANLSVEAHKSKNKISAEIKRIDTELKHYMNEEAEKELKNIAVTINEKKELARAMFAPDVHVEIVLQNSGVTKSTLINEFFVSDKSEEGTFKYGINISVKAKSADSSLYVNTNMSFEARTSDLSGVIDRVTEFRERLRVQSDEMLELTKWAHTGKQVMLSHMKAKVLNRMLGETESGKAHVQFMNEVLASDDLKDILPASMRTGEGPKELA